MGILYDPAINVNPIYIDQEDEMKEELSPLHDEPRDVNLIETRYDKKSVRIMILIFF